uniref:Beta-carotene 15,15'-monooxygenase n=1 Tax=Thermus islandicus TaxID=540988 RepID=A0A831XHH6_9DEIN
MASFYLLPLALLPGTWALGLLLLSALVLGLPHGAADLVLARRLGLRLVPFVGLYLLLAGLALGVFLLFPPLALLLFLALALLHWGRLEERGALGYLRAALVLLLPFLCHREAIGPFLRAFAGGFAPPPGLAALVLSLLLLLALREKHPLRAWGDTLGLFLLALLAHPYAALAGYFLLEHSLKSLRLVGVQGREWLWVYGGTLGGLGLALLLYPRTMDPLAAYMGAVFALTPPHLLVVELWLGRLRPRGRWPAPGR